MVEHKRRQQWPGTVCWRGCYEIWTSHISNILISLPLVPRAQRVGMGVCTASVAASRSNIGSGGAET